MLGLCVGHDTLFIKYSQAPMTALAVKDRVTGHNPLAAIYLAQGYYNKKFYPDDPEELNRTTPSITAKRKKRSVPSLSGALLAASEYFCVLRVSK